jgi:hypothetical protein
MAIWTDVKVGGAALGDTVAVGFTRPIPAGAILAGASSVEDTVTVTLFNATTKPPSLSSGVL